MLDQRRDERRHAVVPQAAGVNPVRDEAVPQGVHLDERRHFAGIAKVIGVLPARDRRACVGLDRQKPRLGTALQAVAQERKGEPREIAATTDAPHDQVGHRVGALHLEQRLFANDGLMHQDVIEHASK